MRAMRAYALAGVALAAFFAGLAPLAAGASFRGVDTVAALSFTVGAAVGIWTYLRETTAPARRIAVVAAGLNVMALLLLGAASL